MTMLSPPAVTPSLPDYDCDGGVGDSGLPGGWESDGRPPHGGGQARGIGLGDLGGACGTGATRGVSGETGGTSGVRGSAPGRVS